MASRFRFVHAADLHLDTPFEGVAGPAPAVADALREASLRAWDNLVELTLREEADFLLIAGDVYDGARRGVRGQIRFVRGLERLAQAGVQVFVVHGNHDPLEGWVAVRDWPTGVTVFGSAAVTAQPVTVDGRPLALVHGVSYARRDTSDNLARGFSRAPDDCFQIGLLHANVGGDTDHYPYAPCSLTDLVASGLDYWALGHIHRRRVLRESAPFVAYPGDIQGRSPKPSETGAKGCLLVEVDGVAVTSCEFAPVDVVRFVECRHDIGADADVSDLQAGLAGELAGLCDEHAGRGLLVRITLEGRGDVAAELGVSGAEALLRELRASFAGRDPFLWVESARDRTRLALDLDALRARGDFAAELLRLGDGLRADPAALSAFVVEATAPIAAGRFGRAVSGLSPDELPEVFDDALARALDLLERETGA